MARIAETGSGLVKSMWVEAGIQFRSNLIDTSKIIELHSHSYDHVSMVTYGWFLVKEITKDGEIKEYQMASNGYTTIGKSNLPFNPIGYRIVIPAYHEHTFTLIEDRDRPAEILCMWASDGTEKHDGC